MSQRILVCDFPSEFLFPPTGYGGIERWLWSVAKESHALGLEVIFSGPLWRKDLLPNAAYFEDRITAESVDAFRKKFGVVDYLVGGHEYFGNPVYDVPFREISDRQFSFQHGTKPYATIAYDAERTHLFCYSAQMLALYREQSPHQLLCSHDGIGEEAIFSTVRERYIVWMGRLDRDKAPHYAIMAAMKLGIPIYLLGSPQYQPEYEKKYAHLFTDPLVRRCGTVAGTQKMTLISRAQCAVYTLDQDYVEAGVAVLGEFLKCGVAVAAITWNGEDCSVAAIRNDQGGYVAMVHRGMTDDQVSDALAASIERSMRIPREVVYGYGSKTFDSRYLVKRLLDVTSGAD